MIGRLNPRRLALMLAAVVLLLGAGAPVRADPFHHAGPAPGRHEPAAPSVAAVGGGFMAWLAASQHGLNDAIAEAFHDVETKNSRTALALILGLAFLYGMLHAIGPGHGKSVVASYFVAHPARWTGGILMGGMISLIQGASAIVLVGLLAILLRAKQIEVLGRSTVVEFVSYGLIVAIGAVMFYRAATGRLHAHDEAGAHPHGHHDHHHAGRLDRRLIVATGLTPCASAIIILLFALANGAFGLGVLTVAVLTVGMAVTISTIGVLVVFGRRALLRIVDKAGMQTHRLERGLAMAAAIVIVGVSGLMMYDAWTRL
jgi:ABC-type nickel/cobalt efflux system permease component RcnA